MYTTKAPAADPDKLEVVTVSVGFDDMLEQFLHYNMVHFDNVIVVTAHDDDASATLCTKYGATCVKTDLFNKDARKFNKGAAINSGFDRFRFGGWRLHLDSDIILPGSFRRVIQNQTHLETDCFYGADRINVIGVNELKEVLSEPQVDSYLVHPRHVRPITARFLDHRGYCPIGFFQMWHSSCQQPYPFSRGTAAHDDVMFAEGWPTSQRRLLPTVIVYHLCAQDPVTGENWDGDRTHPRLT
jgi:hypothetical protein